MTLLITVFITVSLIGLMLWYLWDNPPMDRDTFDEHEVPGDGGES